MGSVIAAATMLLVKIPKPKTTPVVYEATRVNLRVGGMPHSPVSHPKTFWEEAREAHTTNNAENVIADSGCAPVPTKNAES